MARRKNWIAEQIVAKLRPIEVQLARGNKPSASPQRGGELGAEIRNECLKREVFSGLQPGEEQARGPTFLWRPT